MWFIYFAIHWLIGIFAIDRLYSENDRNDMGIMTFMLLVLIWPVVAIAYFFGMFFILINEFVDNIRRRR